MMAAGLQDAMYGIVSRVRRWSALPVVRRLGSGTTWQLVGAVFNQGSTFALGLVVANLLGRESYGSFALVLTTIMTIGSVMQLGIPQTTVRYVAAERAHDRARAGRLLGAAFSAALVSGLAGGAVVAIFATPLAVHVLEQPAVARLLAIAAPAVFFFVLSAVFTAGLNALERFSIIARAGVVAGTVYLALGALAAYFWGATGAVGSVAVSFLVQSALLGWHVRRETRADEIDPGALPLAAERAELVHYALPAAISGVIVAPAMWAVTALVARGSDGLTQVALYAAAMTIRTMVMFVPHLVNAVAFSMLNNARGARDAHAYRATFWLNLLSVTAITGAGAASLWFLSPWLLALFGKSFADARPVVGILLAACVLEAVAVTLAQVTFAHGRMWRSFAALSLPPCITMVAVAALLAPSQGASGGAWGVLAGFAVGAVAAAISAATLGLVPSTPEAVS
jgi:O-antigen/teichoic acid export membrane protein